MAGLPGPRGAPGPVGPPGDSQGWLQGCQGGQAGHRLLMEMDGHWVLQGREVLPTGRLARSNWGFYLLIVADCFHCKILRKGLMKSCLEGWAVQ